MKWRPFGRVRGHRARMERDVVLAEKQLRETRSKRSEVSELSTWAREARERNHLTAMFYRGLAEGGNRG